MSSAIGFNLDQSKILLVKGLSGGGERDWLVGCIAV